MDIHAEKGQVRLSGVGDFMPQSIFDCGQCFRWTRDAAGAYTGVVRGVPARVWTRGGDVFITGTLEDFNALWRGYFDLDRDYGNIRKRLSVDAYTKDACDFGAGLRILKQDEWEALCSFILSQCNNIPRIRGIIGRLCALYGDRVEFEGDALYTFPSAGRIAALTEKELEPLRCGYRAPYVRKAAQAVAGGQLDFESLRQTELPSARAELMRLDGVGGKVADCMLLYGLNRLDAFPMDVWMRRAVATCYGDDFDPHVFGEYAGIAQQYIFNYIRNGGKEAV